jgi:hypothetical protein
METFHERLDGVNQNSAAERREFLRFGSTTLPAVPAIGAQRPAHQVLSITNADKASTRTVLCERCRV